MTYYGRSSRLVLALAALGGCTNDDGNSETGASASAGDGSTDITTADSTMGTSESSAGNDSGSTTAPTSDDGSDMGIPCEPDPVPQLCIDYGDKWVECIYEGAIPADGIQDGCSCFLQLALEMYGGDCVSALEDYYACIAQADCMSIAVGEACTPEVDVIAGICPSLSPQ